MKKIILASALLSLTVPVASFAQGTATPATAAASAQALTSDQYVATAASSDMFEIRSSEIALEKAQGAEVKEFAQHMVADHSATTEKLMAAAKAENITPPTVMMEKHATMVEELDAADDASFDALYLEMQVTAHEEAVALHTAYAENGDVEALQEVATSAVPIVTEHLEEVQALAGN